jgi:uncharacterized YigZ family protein
LSPENLKFKTVASAAGPAEYKEKGSRFFSFLLPASSPAQVEKQIEKIRKKYHNASHVCYACRLGEGDETFSRYHDNGEPAGTAGSPIYNEIKGKDLYNVLLVVVRYFGGTKLGTGRLARAYAQAARSVLEMAKLKVQRLEKKLRIIFPFERTGDVMQVVQRFSLGEEKREYKDEGVVLELIVPLEVWASVQEQFRQIGQGNILGLEN